MVPRRRISVGMLQAIKRLNRAVDWNWRPTPRLDRPSYVVYGIYRQQNAALLARLLADAPIVHLWALDSPHPLLEAHTSGVGKGSKFELLNNLVERQPPPDEHIIVFTDDDYVFTRGRLSLFVTYQAAYGFDLAQPAHTLGSHYMHHVTLARPRLTARKTRFVEIGPVFAVAPTAAGVLPFPEDAGMGWGLDLTWATVPGLSLGIVDAVTIDHLGPVGAAYDSRAASASLERVTSSVGFPGAAEIMKTERRYWRVRRAR